MGKGALLSLLELLPEFEGVLLLIPGAVFCAGLLLQLALLRRPGGRLGRLPAIAAAAVLVLSGLLWRLAPAGGVGEGRRAMAVMLCYFALPALLGAGAGLLARRRPPGGRGGSAAAGKKS